MPAPNATGRVQRLLLPSAAIARIQAAARELTGGTLLFLARHGGGISMISPDADTAARSPGFPNTSCFSRRCRITDGGTPSKRRSDP